MEVLFAELLKHPSDSPVLEELAQRMRPIIMTEALKYRSTLPYDSDDYMQEGRILLWQIALQKTYRRGCFTRYFATAIRFRFSNLYRDYVLRNYICIGECTDFYGNTFQILIESDYARAYRKKHREHCRKSYAKKRAQQLSAKQNRCHYFFPALKFFLLAVLEDKNHGDTTFSIAMFIIFFMLPNFTVIPLCIFSR